jgi:hypothetical protein
MKITISDTNFKVSVCGDTENLHDILSELVIPAIVALGYDPDDIREQVNNIISIDEKPSCFFN